MNTKETIINVLDMLTEEQLMKVLLMAEDFLKPGDETLKAFEEAEYISEHPEEFKAYSSADEMIKDILNEKD